MAYYPKITFKVKTINYLALTESTLPDTLENTLFKLRNQEVWVTGVDYALKDGDEFTLYGERAFDVYKGFYLTVPEDQRYLEVIYYGNINKDVTYGSLYFDGSSNIVLNGSNDWAVGTEDFTVEWFQYQENDSYSYSRIFAVQPYPNTQIGASVEPDGNNFYAWIGGEGHGSSISNYLDQWSHMAITRSSGTLRLFKDGNELNSFSIVADVTDNSNPLYIGSTSEGDYFTGYITNFNFVKGTAIYTGNFTPPTSPITANPNTKLLLLASSEEEKLKDSSSSNKSVTNNGVTWSALSPFI
jgi:hypothetical protein